MSWHVDARTARPVRRPRSRRGPRRVGRDPPRRAAPPAGRSSRRRATAAAARRTSGRASTPPSTSPLRHRSSACSATSDSAEASARHRDGNGAHRWSLRLCRGDQPRPRRARLPSAVTRGRSASFLLVAPLGPLLATSTPSAAGPIRSTRCVATHADAGAAAAAHPRTVADRRPGPRSHGRLDPLAGWTAAGWRSAWLLPVARARCRRASPCRAGARSRPRPRAVASSGWRHRSLLRLASPTSSACSAARRRSLVRRRRRWRLAPCSSPTSPSTTRRA